MNRAKAKWMILFEPLFFGLAPNASACEPILPFMEVVGGPAMLTGSWIILLAVVALKAVIFSASQKQLSFGRGILLMVVGNVLTTLIGVIAAAMIGSGAIMLIGFVVVWALCMMPAKRLLAVVKHPWLRRFSPGGLAGVMSIALVVSCLLFGTSSFFADANHMAIYWLWKLAAVYIALIVSIVLTSFWEEWTIWKLSSCPPDYTGFVRPVIRANLIALMLVMVFGAAVALPKRFKSPDFLVKLVLVADRNLR